MKELKERDDIGPEEKITVIVVMSEKPNDNIPKACYEIFLKTGVYVQVFSLGRLAFNITNHKMVPKHEKLGESDKKFMEDHDLDTNSIHNIPQINYTDPVAMFIGLKPNDICKITRFSKFSDTTTSFMCV